MISLNTPTRPKAISRKLERYNGFIIQHIDNKTKFEEKILSTSFFIFFPKKKLTYILPRETCNKLQFMNESGAFVKCGKKSIEHAQSMLQQIVKRKAHCKVR